MAHYKKNNLKSFENSYEAGYDCGLHGANNFNSHYKWFMSKESTKQWELGKRNAVLKNENKGSQKSPFGIGS